MNIRIIKTPPGEAPEEVRRAWVGLTLPIPPRFAGRRHASTVGVVSGPKSFLGVLFALISRRGVHQEDGYFVVAETAVEILARHSPDAAAWWRQHAPRSIAHGQMFVFAGDACEEIL